jgi:regulator of sigma E protease
VFIHEFGHYIVAKWCGVKITAFSIGFGKEIFGWNDKSGTRWKVSLIPMGGYVKMYGDASAASNADFSGLEAMPLEEKRKTFHYKPLWQKACVVAAGPFANFILTIGVFTYFIMTVGLSSTEPVIGAVMENSAAQEAGLKAGDRVLTINGDEIRQFNDIPYKIATNLGTPVTIVFERAGEQDTVTLTPREFEDEDALGNKVKRPLIGLRSLEMKFEDVGAVHAVWEATKRTYQVCETTLHVLGQMVTGQRGVEDMKGPVGIAQLSGQATDKGVSTTLWLIALLSANLGLVNLLPIPMLDGGHLLFYAVEAGRGRPLAQRVQEYAFRVGFALIITLMVFTIFNDFRQMLF